MSAMLHILKMRTFNLTDLIAFMFEAFDKIRDTNAPARTGYIKCASLSPDASCLV